MTKVFFIIFIIIYDVSDQHVTSNTADSRVELTRL